MRVAWRGIQAERASYSRAFSRCLGVRFCSSSISNAFAFESLQSSASDFSWELFLISHYPFNKMSGTIVEDSQHQVLTDCTIKNDVDGEGAVKDVIDSDVSQENAVPSPEEEEEIIKKKYGGLLPKKPPLISKDHEHAFFDSADWALGKQGAQKPKGPLEALRPKLQPTPHYQGRSRRSAYAPADDGNEGNGYHSEDPEDESHKGEDGSEKDHSSEEKSCQDELHDVLC